MDADCVYYNLNQPEIPSKLTCSGIPSNTSLTLILEKFDEMLCGFVSNFGILVQDTNSIDMSISTAGNVYTISSNLKIDPSSTAPVSITSSGLKVDCCESCSSTTITINSTLHSITKETNFFATLQPQYFTKSDFINSLNFTDSTTVTGTALSYIKYSTLNPTGFNSFSTVGGTKSVPVYVCSRSILGATGYLLVDVLTKAGCFNSKMCGISSSRVNYSERFSQPYRQNFQINRPPIVRDTTYPSSLDKGILYFSDTVPYDAFTSNGGVIRKINLNTKEVVTISGVLTSGTNPNTLNYTLGNSVSYDYPSSICIDEDEINNDEPTLYFAVFKNNGQGGKIIRLVKETSSNCDERKNWRTYVIAGTGGSGNSPSVFGSTTNGTTAVFGALYGIKRWLDINGKPSFYCVDSTNATIKFIYFNGGDPNSSNSWRVTPVSADGTNPITLSGIATNINVDVVDTETRLIVMEDAIIKMYKWTGTSTPTASQCRNLSSVGWTTVTVVNNPAGTVDGTTSTGARVNQPSHIYKYTDSSTSDSYYIFGQEVPLAFQTQPNQSEYTVVRTIYEQTPTSFQFNTICQMPSYALANVGNTGNYTSGTVNGLSQGFFVDLKGNLYDFTLGGIRQWDYITQTCSVFAGGSSSGDTQLEYANLVIPLRMDTQYELSLSC